MTKNEFRNLQHGDKIYNRTRLDTTLRDRHKSRGLNYIVHNNQRSRGIVVVARTDVIQESDCTEWSLVKPVCLCLEPGTYKVIINRKID